VQVLNAITEAINDVTGKKREAGWYQEEDYPAQRVWPC